MYHTTNAVRSGEILQGSFLWTIRSVELAIWIGTNAKKESKRSARTRATVNCSDFGDCAPRHEATCAHNRTEENADGTMQI